MEAIFSSNTVRTVYMVVILLCLDLAQVWSSVGKHARVKAITSGLESASPEGHPTVMYWYESQYPFSIH